MNQIILSFLIATVPHATAAKPATGKEVAKVLASYRDAKAVSAKVQKTVVQETLGTSMKSTGDFFFSKGKLRLEMSEPERTILVYDGKTIWFEQRADEEHVLVTKMRANELRKSDSLLASLFDNKNVLEKFNLKKSGGEDSKKFFVFEPKDKKKSDVQMLEIILKGNEILRISYKDQIENQVTLDFSGTSRGEVSATKFAYTPPKGAEIEDH